MPGPPPGLPQRLCMVKWCGRTGLEYPFVAERWERLYTLRPPPDTGRQRSSRDARKSLIGMCKHVCKCVYVRLCTYVYTRVYTCRYNCIYACACNIIRVYMYVRVHTCMNGGVKGPMHCIVLYLYICLYVLTYALLLKQ